MENRVYRQEKYSRRTCLLLHGIEEINYEKIDHIALEAINEKLEMSINESDINKGHRICRKNQNNTKPRAVIIKFARYNNPRKVFLSKKKLKGSRLSITESVTSLRMTKLNSLRNLVFEMYGQSILG